MSEINIGETLEIMKEQIEKTKKELSEIEEHFENLLEKHFYTSLWKNIKNEEISSFVKKPYLIIPYGENEWRLYVPKFIPLEVGWLEFQTDSFNVFRVNRWMEWLTPLPDVLKDDIGIEKPEFKIIFDWEKGVLNVEEGNVEKAKKKYGKFIHRQLNHSTFQVKSSQRFSFLVELLKEGILPYRPKPANPQDFYESKRVKFELRDYQKNAWDTFLKFSHVGVFFPFGAGKTFLGLYAIAQIKGKKLIVVPSITLKEQWEERIKKFTLCEKDEYEITTYYSLFKYRNRKFDLVIIDESHHSPADVFSLVFFIPRKYTISLSASPWREDGRTELIFTLGYPIGADWNYFWKKGIVKKPVVKVIVVKSHQDKIFELDKLLKEKSITLIYCDSLKKGNELSKRYNTEFIYSETKKRLEIVQETLDKKGFVVLSRVGDEGVSLPTVQRIIEFDFLYGSRRQEAQRCFPPDQIILTPYPIEINKIKEGQSIIGNSEANALNLFSRDYDGELVVIKPHNFPEIRATPEHPFLAIIGKRCRFKSKRNIAYCRPNCKISPRSKCSADWTLRWMRADELKEGDWLVIPKHRLPEEDIIFDLAKYCKNTYFEKCKFCGSTNLMRRGGYKRKSGKAILLGCKDCGRRFVVNFEGRHTITPDYIFTVNSEKKVKRFVRFNEDLAYIFGWYLAEGSTIAGQGIKFNLGKHEMEIAKRLKELLFKVFEVNSTIRLKHSVIEVVCYSSLLEDFFTDQFGEDARNKKIPYWLFNATKELVKTFFDAYCHGDGYKRRNEIEIKSASTRLIRDLQILLLLKFNLISSFFVNKDETGFKRKDGMPSIKYCLSIQDTERRYYVEDDSYFYVRVRKIGREKYKGKVFNLQTTNETYCIPFIVHNCGRLFHSFEQGEHYILMTIDEFNLYKKRLYSLLEKGIEINVENRLL
jgi:DNA excision repair protein ERCC-3